MNESEFDNLAEETLKALTIALDDLGEEVDADHANGILTVEFAAGGVPYIINSHRAARQIWLAAEQQAGHFTLDPESGRWLNTRTGAELFEQVETMLSGRLGRTIAIARPKR